MEPSVGHLTKKQVNKMETAETCSKNRWEDTEGRIIIVIKVLEKNWE